MEDCSICNSQPGELTLVEFQETGGEVTLPMCRECFEEFSAESLVTVSRLDE